MHIKEHVAIKDLLNWFCFLIHYILTILILTELSSPPASPLFIKIVRENYGTIAPDRCVHFKYF